MVKCVLPSFRTGWKEEDCIATERPRGAFTWEIVGFYLFVRGMDVMIGSSKMVQMSLLVVWLIAILISRALMNRALIIYVEVESCTR